MLTVCSACLRQREPPPEVIKKIHQDITEIIQRPEVKRALEARSLDAQGKDGSEFQAIITRDTVKWRRVITTANIKDE